jgi:hypothetical protein
MNQPDQYAMDPDADDWRMSPMQAQECYSGAIYWVLAGRQLADLDRDDREQAHRFAGWTQSRHADDPQWHRLSYPREWSAWLDAGNPD